MLESQIQSKIKKKLEADGWLVIKLIQTSMPGVPDLLAIKSGRSLFIEVKQPGKKPTALQSHRLEQITKIGFTAFAATSWEEVREKMNRNELSGVSK